jgi:hypothetical protein
MDEMILRDVKAADALIITKPATLFLFTEVELLRFALLQNAHRTQEIIEEVGDSKTRQISTMMLMSIVTAQCYAVGVPPFSNN